jgi:tuftelin-interacting protein 11
MEEDQQYERFDVDNDFEGGEWIGGEFFATGRRRKRQQVRARARAQRASGA